MSNEYRQGLIDAQKECDRIAGDSHGRTDRERKGAGECSSAIRAILAQPAAPVTTQEPVAHPFVSKVIGKLKRFDECASDFESGGADIGRHWFDLLTQLGLLNRIQRSPALWEITQQGEDVLEGYSHADASEVERLRVENKRLWTAYSDQQDKRIAAEGERDNARAQLAERDALLREAIPMLLDDAPGNPDVPLQKLRDLLSASAEPSAPSAKEPCSACGVPGFTANCDKCIPY